MLMNTCEIFKTEAENEDYVNPEDGLLYCGKCHTPREKYFPEGLRFGDIKTHPVLCRCRAEAQQRRQAEEEERRRLEQIQELRREAFRDFPARDWRFEAVNSTHQLELARSFVDHWEQFRADGMGLLLFGDVGTGKSYAAGCIANALIDGGHSVRFVGLSDLVNRMQGVYGMERDEYIADLLAPELLILDDLGAERSTSFGREQVFDVVNKRTMAGKSMVVTTNIPLHVMQTAADIQERRIYDRIQEVCTPIQFHGENYRKAGAAKNLKKAAALLGRA